MNRKAATRGRKGAARSAGQTSVRATSRTGKKTASARAAKQAVARAPLGRQSGPARKRAAAPEEYEIRLSKRRVDLAHPAHTEDDEDLDWLKEDEDPRSQIVEGDDEEEPKEEEDW